jgi:hypothetical protein
MASPFDAIGSNVSDASNFLGDLNAIIEPLASPEALVAGNLPAIDSCLAELVINLALVRDSGLSEGEQKRYLLNALKSPFNELTAAVQGLFVPGSGDLSDVDFESAAQSFAAGLIESLKNPFAAIMQAQAAMFQTSMEQLGDIFVGQKGVHSQIYDKVSYMLNSLFFDQQEAGYKIGGFLWFALSEGLPAVENELRYLRQMKRQINTTIEEASKLPPTLTPTLPSFFAAVELCEVEEHLKRVADQLRRDSTFDRPSFNQATAGVCGAAEAMRDGIIPEGAKDFLKDQFGFDDRQIKALGGKNLLPNIKFQVSVSLLRMFHAYVQEQDRYVRSLHENLTHFIDVLESTLSLQIGDILALIIDVIRMQITILRTDLDGMAQGYARTLPDDVPDGGQAQTFNPDEQPYRDDIFALLSAQASTAIALEVLCFVMGRVRQMYGAIDSIISKTNEYMKPVVDAISVYKNGMKECGDGSGATVITSRLNSFFRAAEGRMRGSQSAEYVAARAKDLRDAITEHEKFLACMRKAMLGGNQTLLEAVVFISNAIAFAKNLYALYKTIPALYNAIRSLDIAKMLGVDGAQTTALGAILRALQCFVLQCDNPFIASLAEQAGRQFQGSLDQNKARAVTVGSLDEVSATSRGNNISATISSFLRLIRALQRLLNFDLNDLCALDFSGNMREENTPPPTGTTEPDSISDRAIAIAREEEAAEEGREGATPFSEA